MNLYLLHKQSYLILSTCTCIVAPDFTFGSYGTSLHNVIFCLCYCCPPLHDSSHTN